MTADIALVVDPRRTREWAYTAMSRATLATHYYEVFTPPERDTSASSTGKKPAVLRKSGPPGVDPQRIEGVGTRLPGALRDARCITVEDDLRALATDRQRALVEMLGGSELAQEATRVEPGRRSTAGGSACLRPGGTSVASGAFPRRRCASGLPARWPASNAEDAAGPRHLEGKAVAGWLTPEIDAQLEASQLEFEREQGISPELTAW